MSNAESTDFFVTFSYLALIILIIAENNDFFVTFFYLALIITNTSMQKILSSPLRREEHKISKNTFFMNTSLRHHPTLPFGL